MKKALKGCQSVRVVIVISSDNWGERGKGLKRLGYTLSKLFNNFLDVKESILPVFNRFNMEDLPAKISNLYTNLRPEEKADENFNNFLQLLNEQTDLVSFEPLTSNPV